MRTNGTDVSERASWTVEGVLDAGFDFSRRFLPETLAQVNALDGLSGSEKHQLNQIRGLTYAHVLGLFEGLIIRESLSLASRSPLDQPVERRALLRFAEEESRHQILFERVKAGLLPSLGSCGLVAGAAAVAGVVVQKSELCVLLLTVMLEMMTQHHFTHFFCASERREALDPTFVKIFKSHGREEARHVKLGQLEIQRCAAAVGQDTCEAAVDELLEIAHAFDRLFDAQVDMDLESLERLAGRTLSDPVKRGVRATQHKAYRFTFLVSALRNPKFRAMAGTLTESGARRLDAAAAALST